MMTNNQIERLIIHTKRQLNSINKQGLNEDPADIQYRKGFMNALKIVLYGDENSINDNPINKEKQCTRPLMKSISTLVHKIFMQK